MISNSEQGNAPLFFCCSPGGVKCGNQIFSYSALKSLAISAVKPCASLSAPQFPILQKSVSVLCPRVQSRETEFICWDNFFMSRQSSTTASPPLHDRS